MALFQDPKKGEMAGFIGVAVIACGIFGSQLITKISSGTLSFEDDMMTVLGFVVCAVLAVWIAIALARKIATERAERANETDADRARRAAEGKVGIQKNIHILLILLLAASITGTIVVFVALAGGFQFGPMKFLVYLFPMLIVLFGMLYAMQAKYYREHGGPQKEEPEPSPMKQQNPKKQKKGAPSASKSKRTVSKGKKAVPRKVSEADEDSAETAGPFGFDPKTAGESVIAPSSQSADAEPLPTVDQAIDQKDGDADQDPHTGAVDPFESIRKK